MRHHYFQILFAMSILACGCKRHESILAGHSDSVKYPLLFKNTETVSIGDGITFYSQLRANASGDSILLLVQIENKTDDTLRMNMTDIQLVASDGIRSGAVIGDVNPLTFLPDQKKLARFYFHPVNNLIMYTRANYTGDLDSSYHITYNYLLGKTIRTVTDEQTKFSLPTSLYKQYVSAFAKEHKIKLFQFNKRENLKMQLEETLQNKNFSPLYRHAMMVQVSKNEVLIDGTLIHLNFYSLDSMLYLQARIVNHGEHSLVVEPDIFMVNDQHLKVKALEISVEGSGTIQDGKLYLVPGGARLSFECKFKTNARDGFSLSIMDAIHFHKRMQKIFIKPFEFTQDYDYINQLPQI
jgi:hypothetical protein